MNVQQRGLITLIKSALSGKRHELPDGFALEGVIDVVREHQISPLVYYGALNCGFDKNSEAMKKLFENSFPLVILDERQRQALEVLCEAFESNGIEYMLLKGSVLKSLYPRAEMRVMGDIDILIKTEQYESIKKVMLELGFVEKVESNHEFIWVKDNLCIELHKRLIPSYNKDFYAYFGDGWELAERCSGFKYSMKNEAFFIHLITHFAKHYRDSGIGIKHIVDLWVYKNAKPQLDWEYVKSELKRLRLYEFFENVEKTLDVWFGDADETFETKLITDMVFNSGAYGTAEDAATSKIIRETQGRSSFASVKLANRIKTVFPSYKQMCEKYDFLGKAPVLLPVMWIVRLFNVIIFKQGRVRNYIEKEKRLTNDTIYERKEKLNAVGLDFYSEEDVK